MWIGHRHIFAAPHLAVPLYAAGRARSRLPLSRPATRGPALGSQLTNEVDLIPTPLCNEFFPRPLPALFPALEPDNAGILPRGVDRGDGSALSSTAPAAIARADARASATDPEQQHIPVGYKRRDEKS